MNGVAGPPVYYPPGPLFTKKEECSAMSMEQVRILKMHAIVERSIFCHINDIWEMTVISSMIQLPMNYVILY